MRTLLALCWGIFSAANALCPCPGTECVNSTAVSACTPYYFARGLYNVRVKIHTTDASNVTVRTMPGDKSSPVCSTVGTLYSDLSQLAPVECYESSTYFLNTCSTNGFTVVFSSGSGGSAANYIITQSSAQQCPTPSPTAAPSASPTPEPPTLAPSPSPSAAPTYSPTPAPSASSTSSPALDDDSGPNAGLVYSLSGIGGIGCIMLVGFVLLRLEKRKKRQFSKIGDDGDGGGGGGGVPMREKRESRSSSRSRSKRQSGKFAIHDGVELDLTAAALL